MTTTEDERRAVDDITARLAAQFSQPRERISAVVDEAHHELDGTPIRDFVPILVERQARERLLRRI